MLIFAVMFVADRISLAEGKVKVCVFVWEVNPVQKEKVLYWVLRKASECIHSVAIDHGSKNHAVTDFGDN